MKKTILIMVGLLVVVSLSACGGKNNSQVDKNTGKINKSEGVQKQSAEKVEDREKRDDLFSKKRTNFKIALISMDGAKATKQMRQKGVPTIGCDDVVIYKELSGNANAKEILEKMFTFKDYDEGSKGEYNVFYSSDLKVDDLSIDKNGIVTVKLSGKLIVGGMCDNPRVGAQIEKTLTMLNPALIKGVKVFINGEELGSFLSEKGDVDTEKEGEDTSVNPVDNFNDCAELPDSTVTQGNPRTCTTAQGATFIYDALVDDPFVYQEPPVTK